MLCEGHSFSTFFHIGPGVYLILSLIPKVEVLMPGEEEMLDKSYNITYNDVLNVNTYNIHARGRLNQELYIFL